MRDNHKKIRPLLDADALEKVLDQMADSIRAMYPDPSGLALMGMASRGIPLAEGLARRLSEAYGIKIPLGSLDATFYRDDFHYRKRMQNPSMRIEKMPLPVEGAHIVLVDDVLYTGRTVRAAMEAIMDQGRPRSIRLCVLVDRGHRQLPISADYVGLTVATRPGEEVRVMIPPLDEEKSVWLVEVEAAA